MKTFFTPDEVCNALCATHATESDMFLRTDNKVFSMEIPIACTLSAVEAHSQLGEWKEMVDRCVERVSRVSQSRLDLTLRNDLADFTSLVRLVQREKACCAFFEFAFDVEASGVTLVIRVPEDAVAVLDGFRTSIDAS
jgi:hypothetical protein